MDGHYPAVVHLLGLTVRRRHHVGLFNILGETHPVATNFDGYPLAQQRRAGEALTASFTGSLLGAFVSIFLCRSTGRRRHGFGQRLA